MHKHTPKTITLCLITLITTCFLVNVTFAIHPDRWEHTTEADFESGVAENVLITNLGDIKLAADTKLMNAIPQLGSIIFDMHESTDGTIYIATGPESAIIRKAGDQVDVLAQLPTEQVFTLDELPKGNLLLGISGTPSRLAYLDHEDKIQTLIELPNVRYIWDMIVRNDSVLLATGTKGKLLKVSLNAQNPDGEEPATKKVEDKPQPENQPAQSPIKSNPIQHERLDNPQNTTDNVTMTQVDIEPEFATAKEPDPQSTDKIIDDPKTDDQKQTDKPVTEDSPVQEAPTLPKKITDIPPVIITYQPTVTVLYDASQTNLLCLGQDKLQRIYVGTDTDGLVYRFTEKSDGSVTAFVLYDASEPEIGALLVMSDGTTYAGTADANQARPGRLSKASNKQVGRPNVSQPKPKTPLKPPHQTPTPEPAATPEVAPDVPEAPQAPTFEDAPDNQSSAVTADQTDQAPPSTPQADQTPKPDDKPAVIKVTPAQRHALREEVREQLLAARDQDVMTPLQSGDPAGLNRPAPKHASAGPNRRTPVRKKPASTKGNAIYRISPDGFVNEVFRESVMILKLIALDGKLIVATGNEGQLFQVDPAAEETTILAQLIPEQIPAMLQSKNGNLYLGTANPAQIISLSNDYAKQGQFTSDVLDAKQISHWGNIQFVTHIPKNSSLEIQTRSGNMQDPDKAPWSQWSDPTTFDANKKHKPMAPRNSSITSPAARYLQYRLTLKGDGNNTPTFDQITVNYSMPNLKPQVQSLTATYPDQKKRPTGKAGKPASPAKFANAPNKEPVHHSKLQVQWKATDPNSDKLQYRLEYQIGGSGKWILLRHRLRNNKFLWDTVRAPDGRYLLRVIATDDLDNPQSSSLSATRTSDPILIDNTPPAFVNLKGEIKNSQLTLVGNVVDALSNIAAVHYSADAYNNWKPILPRDQIFDSTNERLAFMISGLSTGRHVITLRVLDDRNNAAYQAVTIDMK